MDYFRSATASPPPVAGVCPQVYRACCHPGQRCRSGNFPHAAPGAEEAAQGVRGVIIAHSRAPEHIWKKQQRRGAAAGSAAEKSSEWGLAWWHWVAKGGTF